MAQFKKHQKTALAWCRQQPLFLGYAVCGMGLLLNAGLFLSTCTQTGKNSNGASLSTSFQLAHTESFGFFDDISDNQWKLHQQRARSEPMYSDARPAVMGTLNVTRDDSTLWLLENVDPIFTCPHMRRVGGRGDGPKWVCDPHRLLKKADCLVYSIGSFGIYKFEDGLVDLLGSEQPHCEIHVFDPYHTFARPGDVENKNIHYHAWGLKAERQVDPGKIQGDPFYMRPFFSIAEMMQNLGHENRRIDILKIDCERCEIWSHIDFLQPLLDIRQILIETHFGLDVNWVAFVNRFLHYGFVPFSKEANTHPGTNAPGLLFEFAFLRLDPAFLGNARPNLTNLASPFLPFPDED